jgi:hypothetical protein
MGAHKVTKWGGWDEWVVVGETAWKAVEQECQGGCGDMMMGNAMMNNQNNKKNGWRGGGVKPKELRGFIMGEVNENALL